jgi:hypothetical protein
MELTKDLKEKRQELEKKYRACEKPEFVEPDCYLPSGLELSDKCDRAFDRISFYILKFIDELPEFRFEIGKDFVQLELGYDNDIIFCIRNYINGAVDCQDMCTYVIHCLKSRSKQGNTVIFSGAVPMKNLFPVIKDIIIKAKEKQWTVTEETISRDSMTI